MCAKFLNICILFWLPFMYMYIEQLFAMDTKIVEFHGKLILILFDIYENDKNYKVYNHTGILKI